MTFTKAIGVLTSTADARAQQWEGVIEGIPPSDLVDELYEADAEEAENIAAMIREAIRVVGKIYS
jgi:hypothetical protein